MRAVIVGEAWGKIEDQMKHALVGPTGRELSLMLGISKFAPYMTVLCRKCKKETQFIHPRCEFCNEHIWPNEFHLLDYWKKLRRNHGIAVTNVFNIRPATMYRFPDSDKPEIIREIQDLGARTKIRRSDGTETIVKSIDLIRNDLGQFFGTEQETEMPAWKASRKSGGSHLKAEHFHHIKHLWDEINSLEPNVVVALGNAACWAILEQTKITTLRGAISWSQRLNRKVLPTFHPAAVLRNMPMRPTVIADLAKASRESEYPEIRRQKRWFTIVEPTAEGIAAAYEWFKKPARAYANDIETMKNQISIVGFARDVDDALVIVFRNEDYSNYWPTLDLEVEAWKLVRYGLQTETPKIYQNGLFDISHFARMGLFPRNCLHDTMLWHHSEYPELPKSLGFLGSIYGDEVAWKVLHQRGSLKRDE